MTERWEPVAGWEGLYEVSDVGKVRSVPRTVAGGGGSHAVRGGRVLKPSLTGDYLHVSLSDGTRRSNARVHVLVAVAFLGARPAGMNACHGDGDSKNNTAENLYWGTQQQNIRDKEAHGTLRYALKRGSCINGHPFTSENTYIARNGTPTCKTCRRDGMRRKARA